MEPCQGPVIRLPSKQCTCLSGNLLCCAENLTPVSCMGRQLSVHMRTARRFAGQQHALCLPSCEILRRCIDVWIGPPVPGTLGVYDAYVDGTHGTYGAWCRNDATNMGVAGRWVLYIHSVYIHSMHLALGRARDLPGRAASACARFHTAGCGYSAIGHSVTLLRSL